MLDTPLVVFDLDGTLADTAGDLIGTLNVILGREGLPALPLDTARPMLGAGARALIRRGFVASGRSIEDARLEQLFIDFLAHYEAHIAEETRLFPGVLLALDRFAADGWNLAVCTNKIAATSVKLLEALDIADRFAVICGQDTFDVCKPDPRALLLTIAQCGGAPERSVMVGDSRTDIDTARAARVPVVAVDFGYTDTPVAQLGPDIVVSHFDQVWDAANALLNGSGAANRLDRARHAS